ncbi:DUF6585 family protein [Micromonospora sp. WMMD736]|uniref:DUF6585 family protein n=1 Tax=Micromonospora sp. WMMD736 TaxID=3404112 RepID=UPI003B93D498
MTGAHRFALLDGQDPYKLLGVPPDAPLEQIRRAYRTAMRTAHPDVGGVEEHAKLLSYALHVLTTCRDDYDRHRQDEGPPRSDSHSGPAQEPDSAHTPSTTPHEPTTASEPASEPDADPWERVTAGWANHTRVERPPVAADGPSRIDHGGSSVVHHLAASILAGLKPPPGEPAESSSNADNSDPSRSSEQVVRYDVYLSADLWGALTLFFLACVFCFFAWLVSVPTRSGSPYFTDGPWERDGNILAFTLFALVGAVLTLAGVRLLLRCVSRSYEYVVVYEDFLIIGGRRGASATVAWGDITGIRICDRTRHRRDSLSRHRYELRLADGSTATLPPHLLQLDQLGAVVEEVFTTLWLPVCRAMVRDGARLDFGPVQIDSEHLWHGATSSVPWRDIERLAVVSNALHLVIAVDAVGDDQTWPTSEIENLLLLLRLSSLLIGEIRFWEA